MSRTYTKQAVIAILWEMRDRNPISPGFADEIYALVEAARREVLEEAARECNKEGDEWGGGNGMSVSNTCATRIRSLKEKP